MMKLALALTLAAAACHSALGQTPIPARPDGWKIGSPGAPIVLESFFDLMCPDCKAANPTMAALREHYGPSTLYYVQHVFPLPYHLTAAWVAAEGVQIVNSLNKDVFKWMDAVFENQESFGYADTVNKTRTEIIQQFGQLAEKSVGIPAQSFAAAYADQNLNGAARISWKYGCSRGVSGTPFFFVNGVLAPADASWSLQQWQALLDPLINDSAFAAKAMQKGGFEKHSPLDQVYGAAQS